MNAKQALQHILAELALHKKTANNLHIKDITLTNGLNFRKNINVILIDGKEINSYYHDNRCITTVQEIKTLEIYKKVINQFVKGDDVSYMFK